MLSTARKKGRKKKKITPLIADNTSTWLNSLQKPKDFLNHPQNEMLGI
jgi:hypothetical protein